MHSKTITKEVQIMNEYHKLNEGATCLLSLALQWHPAMPIPVASMSPGITVLVMCRSGNSGRPAGPCRSFTGPIRRAVPLMVIRGSAGGSTISTASTSGMETQVSSPKHLKGRRAAWGSRDGR